MSKRAHDEVDVGDIKDISSELRMLGDVSLMKKAKSTSYFRDEMTDKRDKVCLYGLDDNIRKRLSEASSSLVTFANCEVKKARHSDEYEVKFNNIPCKYYFPP